MSAPTATAPTAPTSAPAPARRFRLPGHLAWPIGYLAVAIAIFVFYYLISMGYLTSVSGWAGRWIPITTVNQSLVWAMCALGLNIVVGYAGLLDLGYVAFWAIGSYVAGWLMSSFFFHLKVNWFGDAPAFSPQGIHINFWVVLIAAAVVAAVAGIIIGAPTLRLRSDYLALVTLGFGEIIPQFFHNADKQHIGVNISNGTQGISPVDKISGPTFSPSGGIGWGPLGPFDGLSRYIFLIVLTALIVFVSLRLRVGRLGRAWLAIREDELAAGAMGVPLMRTKLAAYAVGAVAGGIAGVAYSVEIAGVSPDSFDFSKSIILLAMVVLGGMGSIIGIGLKLVDFKLEFGRLWEDDGGMRIVLADEISPDNCRLWDVRTNGKMDRDRFREDLGRVEEAYQEVARRLGILQESLVNQDNPANFSLVEKKA